MFDIHKVKPVHGWREFVGEVGIIVLGVLIALSAEQIVEASHWRTEVSDTEQSLNNSLFHSRVVAVERIYLNNCIRKQINHFKTFLAGGGRNSINVFGAPIRPWQESPWTAAMASGIITHVPSELRSKYAEVFDSVAILGKTNRDEFLVWSDLSSLDFDRQLSVASRDRLESDLARAGKLNKLMVIASRQLNDEVKALGIHLNSNDFDDLKEDLDYHCPV